MPDYVIDATVVAFANGDIAGRKPGNLFDRRLAVLEQVVSGARRLRYNAKLLHEYFGVVHRNRNDVIEALFAVLDDPQRSFRVPRSSLPSHLYAIATKKCRWPSHDQHLLAAAIGGDHTSIAVTEWRHQKSTAAILAHFHLRIEYLGE